MFLFKPALIAMCAGITVVSYSFIPSDDTLTINWLKKEAIPLISVEAGNGFEDLSPLKETLKDVRVVGLGEATHGTREFFQFKHRMLEFLVEEMGYNAFLIEATFSECLATNEYVLGRTDNREAAIKNHLYTIWQTEEVAELVDWLREHNKGLPEDKKVRFYGIDVNTTRGSVEYLTEYLKEVKPQYEPRVQEIFDEVQVLSGAYFERPEEEKAALKSKLLELIGFLAANETAFVRQTSRQKYDEALHCARILVQAQAKMSRNLARLYSSKVPKSEKYNIRDVYLAENVQWALDQLGPDSKVVVWAHNGHVSAHALNGVDIPSMGYYLREALGDQYYAIGFDFNEGSFQAVDAGNQPKDGVDLSLKEFTVPPAPKDTLEHDLSLVGEPIFLVNLRGAPDEGPIAEWLKERKLMFSVGMSFIEGLAVPHYQTYVEPKKAFDAFFYIKKTQRAIPLTNPWTVRDK